MAGNDGLARGGRAASGPTASIPLMRRARAGAILVAPWRAIARLCLAIVALLTARTRSTEGVTSGGMEVEDRAKLAEAEAKAAEAKAKSAEAEVRAGGGGK